MIIYFKLIQIITILLIPIEEDETKLQTSYQPQCLEVRNPMPNKSELAKADSKFIIDIFSTMKKMLLESSSEGT